MSGTTRHDNNHAAQQAQHAEAESAKRAAEAKAAKALKPVTADMMLLLLAVDWLHGDKHHYDVIRRAVLKILTDMGEDGAEAKARLETVRLEAAVPPPVKAAA